MCQCQPSSTLRTIVSKMSSRNGRQGWREATALVLGVVPEYRTNGLFPVSDHCYGKAPFVKILLFFFLARISSKIFVYAPTQIANSSEPGISQNWQYLLWWGFDFSHFSAKISTSWDTVLYSSDFWESKTTGETFFPLERLLDQSYKEWYIQQYWFCFHGYVDDKFLF